MAYRRKPTGKGKEEEVGDESEEEEEEVEKEPRTSREGWLYVWRLNWCVSRFEGVPLCILAVGKAGEKETTKEGEWAALMARLYNERYGYLQFSAATKGAVPPRIPGQAKKKNKEAKSRVLRITPEYIHENLDKAFEDLALLLPREPHSVTGLDRGERALRSVLGLSFPHDIVHEMAAELDVDITGIAGKLKATELLIAPLSTFESLRQLFRSSFAKKQELRLRHVTSLMAKAGPYKFHPDAVVEVRPGPRCDPAILTTVAILLPTNAPAPAAKTRRGASSTSIVVTTTKKTVTYAEENGYVVLD